MTLHQLVRAVAVSYLEAVDREAPGLVEGLYLTGSAALGDFQPNLSDVDFVVVTRSALDPTAVGGLERAHADLRRRYKRPHFDGVYVTWHELARHGVTFRGPAHEDIAIWTDGECLVHWMRGNLEGYWRRWLKRSSRLLSWRGLISYSDWSTAWGVLGECRLHYTIATSEITSKQGAGLYALGAFPE